MLNIEELYRFDFAALDREIPILNEDCFSDLQAEIIPELKNKEDSEILSQKILEALFRTGRYQLEKHIKSELEAIKEEIKLRMPEDEKRREFDDSGVVAKYTVKNKYSTDYIGLNEFLYDRGLLVYTTKIPRDFLKKEAPHILETLLPYEYPTEQFVQVHPNKKGRVSTKPLFYLEADDQELAELWRKLKERHNQLIDYEKQAKNKMLSCKDLKLKKSIPTEYGSITLRNKDPQYNIEQIYTDLGGEFLIEHARVDMTLIDNFIYKGILHPNDIRKFRSVIDVALEFTVMDKEIEEKQRKMFSDRMDKFAEVLRNQPKCNFEYIETAVSA